MTSKLHQLLAAEKPVLAAATKMMAETEAKMGKEATFFAGHTKVLKLIQDSPSKDALEKAGSETKVLASTVPDTLQYALNYWANAENILFQKNRTNQNAKADIVVGDVTVAKDVPVDELLGLEARLPQLRELIQRLPTLDASKKWIRNSDQGRYVWQTEQPEVAVKTEKRVEPVVLYAATDKHPAQVKEYTKDDVVGSFELIRQSGAITSRAKADALGNIDALIVAVKKARSQANEVEVVAGNIGQDIVAAIFAPIFNEA
jgi:hypothetical protein